MCRQVGGIKFTYMEMADSGKAIAVAAIGHETAPIIGREALQKKVWRGILVGSLGAAEELLTGQEAEVRSLVTGGLKLKRMDCLPSISFWASAPPNLAFPHLNNHIRSHHLRLVRSKSLDLDPVRCYSIDLRGHEPMGEES